MLKISFRDQLRLFRRILRSVRGQDLLVKPSVKTRTQSVVSESGTWTFALDGVNPNGIALCFGIGRDLGLEIELARRFDMRVLACDPTPRAEEWIGHQQLPPNLTFHSIGLAASDGALQFEEPENPQHVSYSAVRSAGRPTISLPVKRLPSIAADFRLPTVDLLKMDIEGNEYEVIADMPTHEIRPRQILVEFHHRFTNFAPSQTRASIATLKTLGYEVAHVSPNGEEFLFVMLRTIEGRSA